MIGHTMEDGSTYALSDFLAKTNPEWQRRVGHVRTLVGQAILVSGQSEEDIASLVKATPNSIAYTELWAAQGNGLQIGRVKNSSGRFIEATPASIAAAAQTAVPANGDDWRISITDSPGTSDYPIASFTWIVMPDSFRNAETAATVIAFVKWVLMAGQHATEAMRSPG
jgi:phosphate transport system substrate-binding protein